MTELIHMTKLISLDNLVPTTNLFLSRVHDCQIEYKLLKFLLLVHKIAKYDGIQRNSEQTYSICKFHKNCKFLLFLIELLLGSF